MLNIPVTVQGHMVWLGKQWFFLLKNINHVIYELMLNCYVGNCEFLITNTCTGTSFLPPGKFIRYKHFNGQKCPLYI